MQEGGPLPKKSVRSSKTIKYNVRLSMKSIIRAEQILSKSFSDIDYGNPDELMKLLYCIVLSNNSVPFTFEEFILIAENEKQLGIMLKELEKVNKVLEQFTEPSKAGENGAGPQYLKDVAGVLIMSGMDAHYIMEEMDISDIPIFLEAYEKKKREEMEASRLWTFLSIAPHIDTSKVSSPKDLMAFPWEEEEARKIAEASLINDSEMAERFFKEGKNLFILKN